VALPTRALVPSPPLSPGAGGGAGTGGAAGGGDGGRREDKVADIAYLRGRLAWAKGARGEAMALLERSVQLQLAEAEEAPLGLEQFAALDAARALGVVRLMLGAQGADPRQSGEAPSPAVGKSIR
jgi:hypothetical protein